MAEKFSFFMNQLWSINAQTILLVCLLAVTVCFIVNLILILLPIGYNRVKRWWFALFSLSLCLFQTSHALANQLPMHYVLFTISCSFFYAIPLFCISDRRRQLKKEEKELAEFLDKQIKEGFATSVGLKQCQALNEEDNLQTKNHSSLGATKNVENIKPCVNTHKKGDDAIDYTHVKNVIERLEYFPLTPFDKRQVKELELNVRLAESGENLPDLKNKVNDGLGALLKIMSKYGV